jgi:Matrixin
MLSTSSKVIIFAILSSLTAYIIVMYSPFEGYRAFNKKDLAVELLPTIENILVKKQSTRETTQTKNEDPIKVTEEIPNKTEESLRQSVAQTPKVTESKKGVYEILETTHSDTDDNYRPTVSPCISPMGYKIGTFDTKFNISKEQFIVITREAIATWEQAAGTSLFTYNERGSLSINLVYDERQATTVSLGYIALEIENTKQTAENIRKSYEQQKKSYTDDSEAFNQDATKFQERYAIYNEKVKGYNDRGGAPQGEYDTMMKDLDQIKIDSVQFEIRRQDLLKRMDDINAKVKRYNELVAYVNTLIRKSNAIGSRTFTEGRFTPSSNTIDIYQYSDETKLKRVITHELGHAIGIGHVNNVMSVMYSFNSGTNTSLSTEDKQALKDICSSH